MRCSTTTSVVERSATRRPTASRTSSTPTGSRLAVGSSRSNSPGRIASAPASASRCRWPPDSRSVLWSRGSARPTSARAVRTRGQISSRGTARFSSPNATSSPTRSRIVWASGSCMTRPQLPGLGRTPSTVSDPASSPSSLLPRTPASAWSNVDLPAPEAPRSSTRSPGSMRSETPEVAQAARPACRQPQRERHTCAGLTQTSARASRPAANRDSAPDAASALVSAQPTPPASTAPEMTIETR